MTGSKQIVQDQNSKIAAAVDCPVTTSFCAQLLVNAQAKADGNGIAVVKPETPAQKTPTTKPSPQTQTGFITPDVEKAKKEAFSRKVFKAFTSILIARSKTVNSYEKTIMDIDASYVENELAAVEYIEDIYKFYELDEEENRLEDYIHLQPEISTRTRATVVDWLIQAHRYLELETETLYLTINIMDRYLSSNGTFANELHLVGIGAMLLASKYEQIWAPEVNEFVCISKYTQKQILEAEKRILEGVGWNLTVATPYVFLVRYIKAASSIADENVENMAYFLAEMGIVNYATVMFSPSTIAAAAVYAARCTVMKRGSSFWNETLEVHTGYLECDLMECAELLVGFHSTVRENSLEAVYKKYSSLEKGAVALLPPAVLDISLKNQLFV